MNHEYTLYCCDAIQLLQVYPSAIDLIVCSPHYNVGSGGPRNDFQRKDSEYDPKSFGGIAAYDDNLPEVDYLAGGQIAFLEAAA